MAHRPHPRPSNHPTATRTVKPVSRKVGEARLAELMNLAHSGSRQTKTKKK